MANEINSLWMSPDIEAQADQWEAQQQALREEAEIEAQMIDDFSNEQNWLMARGEIDQTPEA